MPHRVGGQGSSQRGSSILSKPVDYVTGLFWGLINFGEFEILSFWFCSTKYEVVVFFTTMLNLAPPTANAGNNRQGGRSGGPGWGGGGGGSGGRNVRGMSDVK